MIRREKATGSKQVKVTFALPVEDPDGPIAVAGDFNGWDPTATPLRKRKGQRTASVALESGRRYSFRYVDAAGRWFNDPAADGYEPNEFGDDNCVLDLTDGV